MKELSDKDMQSGNPTEYEMYREQMKRMEQPGSVLELIRGLCKRKIRTSLTYSIRWNKWAITAHGKTFHHSDIGEAVKEMGEYVLKIEEAKLSIESPIKSPNSHERRNNNKREG